MLCKTITFSDYDGVQHTEDFWFNLSKPELAELMLATDGNGDLRIYLQEIAASNDPSKILKEFRKIVGMSVGQREGSRRFIKSDDITGSFLESPAYEELFMELLQNPDQFVEFIKGMIPADMVADVEAEMNREKDYTHEQLLAMDQAEFDRIAGRDPKNMSRELLMVAMERKNQAA
jgi:hypothetical protein